jgi:hypothetical protein
MYNTIIIIYIIYKKKYKYDSSFMVVLTGSLILGGFLGAERSAAYDLLGVLGFGCAKRV